MKTYYSKIAKHIRKHSKISIEELQELVSKVNPLVKIATTEKELEKVFFLREKTYARYYPDLKVGSIKDDDYYSLILFTEDETEKLTSTCRLLLDNPKGLSEEKQYGNNHLQQLRKEGNFLAEWGRAVIGRGSKISIMEYIPVLETIAQSIGVNKIFVFNRDCDVQRILGKASFAEVIKKTEENFGSKHTFTAMQLNVSSRYEVNEWNEYASSFLTITTCYQSELLKYCASLLFGNVVDLGSGCAKLAPYLKNNNKIYSYKAVDASQQMYELGQYVLNKIGKKNFSIEKNYIEQHKANKKYSSAVSINSLYSWNNPAKVLQHIFNMLEDKGLFVLATINPNLDMKKLLNNVEVDLLFHPDFDKFQKINTCLANNNNANILPLDELLSLVHTSGFTVLDVRSDFYEKGVTLVLLEKNM